MLIVMKQGAPEQDIQRVIEAVEAHGYQAKPIPGANRTAVCVLGNRGAVEVDTFRALPSVLHCIPVTRPYKLVSRETHPDDTVVQVGEVRFGGERTGRLPLIAGPCAVESWEQLSRVCEHLVKRGVHALRGGAFKPRTSPYSFQGLGSEGLALLARARREYGLAVVCEAIDHVNYDEVEAVVDMVQIGARNMQNYSLLRRAGQGTKPVLLKRGMAATIDEWLMAAEYIMSGGNRQVVLCERGVRTFADHTRNTLDLSAIPVVKKQSHLPILVDPSHAAGTWEFVIPLSLGARGVGADGLMVEVHPDPAAALSDGAQSLTFARFDELLEKLGQEER